MSAVAGVVPIRGTISSRAAGAQRARVQRGIAQHADADRYVGTPLQQVNVELVGVELQRDLRVGAAEFRHQRHDGVQHEGRRRVHAQPAGGLLAARGHQLLGLVAALLILDARVEILCVLADEDEIDVVEPGDCTMATVPARYAELGDLHAGIDDAVFSIDELLRWAARDEAAGVPDAGTPDDPP